METERPFRAGAPPITVSVTLFGSLRRLVAEGAVPHGSHTLADGARLADLLAALGIDRGVDLTAAVDGELVELDTRLHDGAQVMLLGPMDGGAR
jgi:sulfur carrier protein ThiS